LALIELLVGKNGRNNNKKNPPTEKQNQRKRENIEFFCCLQYFKEIGERDEKEVIKIFYEK